MSTLTRRNHERALKLVDRLLELAPDPVILSHAQKMRGRMAVPMKVILDKVPGATVVEKAANLEMTRQAWYHWLRGTARPNLKRARQLAKVTGFSVEEIRGASPSP